MRTLFHNPRYLSGDAIITAVLRQISRINAAQPQPQCLTALIVNFGFCILGFRCSDLSPKTFFVFVKMFFLVNTDLNCDCACEL